MPLSPRELAEPVEARAPQPTAAEQLDRWFYGLCGRVLVWTAPDGIDMPD
jgi:hypothetical protein